MYRDGPPYQRRGSLQLWQFLVTLLDDPANGHFIAWTGRGMEFKLIEPEEVSTNIQFFHFLSGTHTIYSQFESWLEELFRSCPTSLSRFTFCLHCPMTSKRFFFFFFYLHNLHLSIWPLQGWYLFIFCYKSYLHIFIFPHRQSAWTFHTFPFQRELHSLYSVLVSCSTGFKNIFTVHIYIDNKVLIKSLVVNYFKKSFSHIVN